MRFPQRGNPLGKKTRGRGSLRLHGFFRSRPRPLAQAPRSRRARLLHGRLGRGRGVFRREDRPFATRRRVVKMSPAFARRLDGPGSMGVLVAWLFSLIQIAARGRKVAAQPKASIECRRNASPCHHLSTAETWASDMEARDGAGYSLLFFYFCPRWPVPLTGPRSTRVTPSGRTSRIPICRGTSRSCWSFRRIIRTGASAGSWSVWISSIAPGNSG